MFSTSEDQKTVTATFSRPHILNSGNMSVLQHYPIWLRSKKILPKGSELEQLKIELGFETPVVEVPKEPSVSSSESSSPSPSSSTSYNASGSYESSSSSYSNYITSDESISMYTDSSDEEEREVIWEEIGRAHV